MLTGALSAVVGAFVGWMLHVGYNRLKIIKINESGWNVILAEAANCHEYSIEFISAKILSPQYRLPTIAYQVSYPLLISHGLVSREEAIELSNYFSRVDDLNRGLENANSLLLAGNKDLLSELHDRNILKARSLKECYDEDMDAIKKRAIQKKNVMTRIWMLLKRGHDKTY